MIRKNPLRLFLGILLGGFAGLSLTSSVLPSALSAVGMIDQLFARWALSDYAAHAVLVWAVGGWAVARAGFPRAGALILGLLGVLSGFFLSLAAFGTASAFLLTAAAAGGFYGVVGGVLLGTVLRRSEPEERHS